MKIIKTTYTQATDMLVAITDKIKEDVEVEHVVVVPEVYTFVYERLLYFRGKGSFSIAVKSLSRMFSQLALEQKVISKYEAMTLIKRIAYTERDNLTCFRSSYKKSGFAKKMYETISRLQDQDIMPGDIQAKSMRKNKMDDIRLIYEKYLQAIDGKMVDSKGKIDKLAQYFDSLTKPQNKHYYFLNFDVYTPVVRKLLKSIDEKCLSLTVFEPQIAQCKIMSDSAVVYKANDDFDQLKEVVRNISNDHLNGMAYDDIIVSGEGLDYERTKRIFDDYAIPFYLDKKASLKAHPLSAFIINAITAATKNCKKEDMIALSKNPCVQATKADRDAFEVYVNAFLVNFGGFTKEFDKESPYAKGAERVRARICSLLRETKWEQRETTGEQFAKKIKKLLGLATRLEDGFFDRISEAIVAAAECISSVFEGVWGVEFLSEAFFDLLASVEYSVVQKVRNCVQVGPLNDFRGQRYKKIYLLNFNEGVLPKCDVDCELLLDGDLKEMEQCSGKELSCKISDLNERYRDELWQLLQNDGKLFLSFVAGEKGKASMQLQRIMEDEGLVEYTAFDVQARLENETDPDTVAAILATEDNAIEQYYTSSVRFKSEIYHAAKHRFDWIERGGDGAVDDEWLRMQRVSASAIKEYYSCPFKYFCNYVLGLKELEDGQVNALDVGNILHAVIAEYLQREECEQVIEVVGQIFDGVIQGFPHALIEENQNVIARLRDECVVFCTACKKQVSEGGYRLVGSEMGFGKEGGVLKPISFSTKDGSVDLVGSIDRVDADEGMGRVVDYKTGSDKKLNYEDIYHGAEVQLPLYASVLKNNGYEVGGFFFAPLIFAWKGVDKVNKLNGIYENSEANTAAISVATAIDKKAGRSKEEIDGICDYTLRITQRAIDNIENGKLDPSPLRGGRSVTCDYCPYAAVCGRDPAEGGARSKRSASDARKYLEKCGVKGAENGKI